MIVYSLLQYGYPLGGYYVENEDPHVPLPVDWLVLQKNGAIWVAPLQTR